MINCSGDTTNGQGILSPTQAYWALQLNQHAVNLALVSATGGPSPYDTVQLTATPVNAAGSPLTGLGVVTYKAADSTVAVSPTGLVTAQYVTNSGMTTVVASLQDTVHNVTHTDSVAIQVVQTPPFHPLATFSLQPDPGDSAKRSTDYFENGGRYNVIHATDAVGDTICNVNHCAILISYRSSNDTIEKLDAYGNLAAAFDTGHVVFTATTLAYGVMRQASLAFIVGIPTQPLIFSTYGNTYQDRVISAIGDDTLVAMPSRLYVGVGAIVQFINESSRIPLDVVFDQPSAVDSSSLIYGDYYYGTSTGTGNISSFVCNPNSNGNCDQDGVTNVRARRLTVPGTYRFHVSRFPAIQYEFVVVKGQ